MTAAQAMTDGAKGGTRHFSGSPDTSWADFARAIMAEANLPCRINDIPTSEYPTPAKRPLNSRLDCSTLATSFGIHRPDWRQDLKAIVKELTQ
jgi:dTDP-4-dehydrorhamnose reductase